MSDNVIKLSDNIFISRKSLSNSQIVNKNEYNELQITPKNSIRTANSVVRNYEKISNLENILEPNKLLNEDLLDSKKVSLQNNMTDEFSNKPTFCTFENIVRNNPNLNENVFKHIDDAEKGNLNDPNKDQYIYINEKLDKNEDNSNIMRNLCCTKYILCDDLSKDLYMIFLDPKSKQGHQIIETDISEIKFDEFASIAYIVNLKDEDKVKFAIDLLINYHSKSINKNAIIMIGGDDKSIMPLIEKLRINLIDLSRCRFAILPIGFSNNLSSTLQFKNKNLVNSDLISLKKLLQSYSKATDIDIDIWKIDLKLENSGGVFQYKEGAKIEILDENKNNIVLMSRIFINNFSLGLDARLGYDKRKNKNTCYYLWECLKKVLCTKTMPLNKYIDVLIADEREIFINKEERTEVNKKSKYKLLNERVVLKNQPNTLICQNTGQYYYGNDLWEKARNNIGLEFEEEGLPSKEDKEIKKIQENDFFKELYDQKQLINDGKLEFLTYNNGFLLACEKVFRGGYAKKIVQSKGPYIIKLKKIPLKSKNDKKHRVYLQIDGENYYLFNPIEIRISLDTNYPKGMVKFLKSN